MTCFSSLILLSLSSFGSCLLLLVHLVDQLCGLHLLHIDLVVWLDKRTVFVRLYLSIGTHDLVMGQVLWISGRYHKLEGLLLVGVWQKSLHLLLLLLLQKCGIRGSLDQSWLWSRVVLLLQGQKLLMLHNRLHWVHFVGYQHWYRLGSGISRAIQFLVHNLDDLGKWL